MDNQHTDSKHSMNLDEMLTPDVLRAVTSFARKYASRMGPLYDPEDLVHTAVRQILWREYEVRNLAGVICLSIQRQYMDWKKAHRHDDLYNTDSLDTFLDAENSDEESEACPDELLMPSWEPAAELQIDVWTAISKLSPQDQRLVVAYMRADCDNILATARYAQVTREAVLWGLPRALKRLRVLLQDYVLPEPLPDKMSPSKHQAA